MHPPWEMTIDRQRSSTFLMYMLLHDVGEDYWSISYFFYSIFFTHDVTTIYLFFLSRQTWLRGPHAAPTIEDYWPKCFYRVQLESGRMHPSVHVRTYQLVMYLGPRTGCNRPLLYCEDEYVRACTLYVGQQVCAYLHPVRGSMLRYYIHPGPGDRGTFDPPRRTGTQVRAYCLPSCTVS